MNIRDEELVQRYFDNAMPSGEEQNFLIDVAARNDMRMAFRSQLELLKAIKNDKDVSGGTTMVRERTLAALGLSAAFVAAPSDDAVAPSFMQSVKSFITKPYTILAAGLIAGGLTTYAVMPQNTAATITAPETRQEQIVTPSAQQMPSVIIPDLQNTATEAPKAVSRSSAPTTKQVTSEPKPAENVPVVGTTTASPEVTVKLKTAKPDKKN
jgi:hypothetical protein